MPRRSPEDRAGSHYRAGGKPPAPPYYISAKAKVLWRKIVNSRPYDYFDDAAQVLLHEFCELAVTQRVNIQMMHRYPSDEKWQRQAARMQAVLNSCAAKLRLSPSAVLSKKRGILDEREVDVEDNNVLLFGGPGGVRF